MADLSYEEKRKQKKEKKQEQKKAQKMKEAKERAIKWVFIAGAFLVVVGLIFLALKANSPDKLAGEYHPAQGAEHIVEPYSNAPYEWNTNPPTAGWHDPRPHPGGFYDDRPSIPRMIHSMEHGAIIVWYKTSVLDEDKEALKEYFEDNDNKKLLVVPYDDMENDFAITAWEYLDTFEHLDLDRIDKFMDDHHDKGPERAPIGDHL